MSSCPMSLYRYKFYCPISISMKNQFYRTTHLGKLLQLHLRIHRYARRWYIFYRSIERMGAERWRYAVSHVNVHNHTKLMILGGNSECHRERTHRTGYRLFDFLFLPNCIVVMKWLVGRFNYLFTEIWTELFGVLRNNDFAQIVVDVLWSIVVAAHD